MKKLIIAFGVIFMFSQCSKKSVDMVQIHTTTPVNTEQWRSVVPQPAPAKDFNLGSYSSFDLPNGLKVIVVENHKTPIVSYQLSLNHDPLIEGDKAGYTSFAGDLMSRGTKSMTKSEIDETIDFIGARLSTNSTGIFASSLKKHSEKLLGVMTDILYNASFPKDEFDKILKQTESELASAKSSPESIASNIASIVNFGSRHPYGEVETEETIKNITVEDCINYYNTYFKPNNAYLVIVGDITAEQAKEEANKFFSNWEKGAIPTYSYLSKTPPEGANVRFGNKDGAVQSLINITYPIDMKPGSDDAIPASLMNSILGGGIFSGRLMQNLREDKAYTYGARSSLSPDRLKGYFTASASVRNEVTDSAVTEFLYEMNRIVSEKVTDKDLQLAKTGAAGSFGRSLESPQTIARFALNTFRYNLPEDYYNNYLKNIDAVTIDDVQTMANKYIHPKNCNIIVVGNKDEVAQKLLKFDDDGKINYYDAFGKEVEEIKIEAGSNITGESVIKDYLKAIGGNDKLNQVKTLYQEMNTQVMGQQATMESYKKMGGKYAMKMSMMGMTVQEQKFDGVKASMGQMGQTQVVEDEEMLNALKNEAVMFEQLQYSDSGYKVELKGIENIQGENCYKVVVTDPTGDSSTEFYNVETKLLARSIQAEGDVVVITDYKDYKDVNGILFPHAVEIDGAAPMVLKLEANKIEVNKEIPDSVFTVE